MSKRRRSGILLHLSALPSPYGIGDMGSSAYKFADFLQQTKQSLWQVLPLNPINQACGNSPYSGISAFAGNIFFISPQLLFEQGFLSQKDIKPRPNFRNDFCDYSRVITYKNKIFIKAYERFKSKKIEKCKYDSFCSRNSKWLDDFSLFQVIRENYGAKPWNLWDKKLKNRQGQALEEVKKKHKDELEKEKFLQYLFFKQWFLLKKYCNDKGISIIGDLPIYVSYDSADVWSNPRIFKLNKEKEPTFIAGVPPDYFSETGQLWGNPVYKWEVLKKSGFKWWLERFEHNFLCYDQVRIDHFRGLVAYWEVPQGAKTAVSGKWVKAPVRDFFDTLSKRFSHLPIIAEDLGIITPDVKKTLKELKFPGMKVLLFAFDEDNPQHPYLPHTYDNNCLVYTGTHDNNTIRGWFDNEASFKVKQRLFSYLRREVSAKEVCWELIRLAMSSVADTAIFPLQDILGLGQEARMNKPSAAKGNWQWRLRPGQLSDDICAKLSEMTKAYQRA